MANNDSAFGLRPVTNPNGTPRIRKYYIAAGQAGAVYVGGLVKPIGSADANGVMSVSGEITTGDVVLGVVTSVDSTDRDSLLYRETLTERYVYVADDPNQIFEVQEDSDGGALAATNVGNLFDLTGLQSGDTTYGRSTTEIDSSTASTGAGDEDVLLIGMSNRPDNVIGEFAKWHVRLNNHFYIDNAVGV